MNDSDLLMKLDKARWFCISREPFYGSLAMALPDVLGNPHASVKTACTDGRRIFWDRAFLAKLTDEETRFVVMHETLHCAHSHLWRFPKADKRTNTACDHAINLTLGKITGIKMPKGGLADPAYANLAEEEILNRLPIDPPGGGGKEQGDENGSGDPCGDFTAPAEGDGKGDSGQNKGQNPGKPGQDKGSGENGQESDGNEGPGKADTLQEEWQERVIQAAQAAKASGKGDIPSDMQRAIERTLRQEVDWKRETADFIKDKIATRNDWSRAARRMATSRVLYPRKRSDSTGLVIVARDTSGSIGQDTLAEFNGLIGQCLAECNCSAIVMDVDAAIHAEHRVGPGEEFPNEAKGGGGTDFNCVQKRIAELIDEGETIAGVVFCTDLCATFPADFCDVATLWLATTDSQAPFGRTVRIVA